MEVFILPEYNDNKDELSKLKKLILKIKPGLIQLNTLDRPGAVQALRSSTRKELQQIVDLWKLQNVEIIAKYPENKKIKLSRTDIEATIIETISRRPCTLADLTKYYICNPMKLINTLII